MKTCNGIFATRAAVLLLVPVFLVAACEKQNNSKQNNAQATHEQSAGGGHQRVRVVCADDIQKYCANAEKKRRCLRENMDKLSEPCKTALAERKGRKARANGGGDDE
jgi:uncharacterized lipoprotein YajG